MINTEKLKMNTGKHFSALFLEFTGGPSSGDQNKKDESGDEKILPNLDDLNSRAGEIARKIKKELKQALPEGLDVEVQIEFSPGSVKWSGVIAVLNTMGAMSGSVSLIEYLCRVLEFIINRVMRSELSLSSVVTTVSEMGQKTKLIEKISSLQFLCGLTMINMTLLLLIIVCALILYMRG